MSSIANAELIAAVEMARDAEWEAHSFYLNAAKKAEDPRAQDLFEQLAAFEKRHFEKLKELLARHQVGRFSDYAEMEFRNFKPGVPSATIPAERLQTAIDGLQVAIEAEQQAHETYLKLAEKTVDERAKKMFRRMAVEEEKHRRILEDQFYALSNKGLWAWGE